MQLLSVPLLADGSFESVSVGTGSSAYRYNPTGSAWTFDGGSGLGANGTGFTYGNPSAPDGGQVAFLQTLGTFRQTGTLAAGTYALTFSAAQRQNLMGNPKGETFQVLVDGVVVGTFNPVSTNYTFFTTNSFTVTGGQHTILFKGTNSYGGDNTAFLDQVQLLSLPTFYLGDESFENVSAGTGSSGYKYNPTGSAWTFDSSSGLSGNGSSLTAGNPPAPDGNQVAFVEMQGTIRQTVTLAAGTYALTFSAAQRQNLMGSPKGETFQVLIDGTVVGTFDPNGFTYAAYTTTPIALSAGSHTILFKGTNLNGGDNTAFLDRVDLFRVPTGPVGDGSFENVSVGTGSSGYKYNPTGSAWTFDSSSGLSGNGSSLTAGNPPAPDGNQVAFVEMQGTIRQTVTLAAGTYALTFSAAQRQNLMGSPKGETFQVLIDGTVVGTFDPNGFTYAAFTTNSFTVTAGPHTILFQGTNLNGGDNTVLLDQVQLVVSTAVTITGLTPSEAAVGNGGVLLTVNGTNFLPSSIVYWNGQPLATIFLSATQLLAQVPVAFLLEVEQASVTVLNPAPSWGLSNVWSLNVQQP